MDALENIKLSQVQIYLLKNLSVLAGVPVSARDLFVFLGIGQDMLLQYFDALHGLVPQWLEYKSSYYIFPKEKAQEFLHYHKPKPKDIYRLVSYFRRLYSEPQPENIKTLVRFEPYVLAILNNFRQPSVLLAHLHSAYAQYLSYRQKYDEALLSLQQAWAMLEQINPQSPLLAQVWNEMSFIYLKENNLDKAFQIAQKAKENLDHLPQNVVEIRINTEFILAEIFFKKKKYPHAINYFLRTLDLVRKSSYNQYRLLVYVYLQLSDAYRLTGNYDKAKFYLDLAGKNLHHLSQPEINIFGERIRLQKKAVNGLAFIAKLKAKFLTYGLIAIVFLVSLIIILILLSIVFK